LSILEILSGKGKSNYFYPFARTIEKNISRMKGSRKDSAAHVIDSREK
jgi:hypothetical protein